MGRFIEENMSALVPVLSHRARDVRHRAGSERRAGSHRCDSAGHPHLETLGQRHVAEGRLMVPLNYNIRSLGQRKATTAASAIGIGAVVFVFASVLMLSNGIEKTLADSGRPDVAIITRAGADAELSSSIEGSDVDIVLAPSQVQRRQGGTPDGTGEVIVVLALDKVGGAGTSNVQVRGVEDTVYDFRREVEIVEGREARPGADEVVVGTAIRGRFAGLELGDSFELRKNRPVTVVGVFADNGSSYESEVWLDLNIVQDAFGRDGVVSSIRARLRSAGDFDAFKNEIESNRQLSLQVDRETAFYEKQSEGTKVFITAIGIVIAVLFSLGAMIGAMITMYSAVANRSREIGALRALGFSRTKILSSFLLESILLALVGGLLGVLASLAMSMVRFSVVNFATWSEIVFSFDATPEILISALVFSLAMGLAGGLFPAVKAARMKVLDALRAA